MFEKRVRPGLEVLLAPLSKGLMKLNHLSPYLVNMLYLASGIAVLPLMLLGLTKMALSALWLSYLLGITSGIIVASKEPLNPLNTLYDMLSACVIDFAIIFGFYLLNPGIIAWISILILASSLIVLTTHLVIGILAAQPSWQLCYRSYGLLDRLEIFVIFSVLLIFPITYGVLGVVLAILLLCTAALKILEFQRSL